MISIDDKSMCCGCSACYSICPKKCISMDLDSEGFLYPKVYKRNCIDCGLCEHVCPIINKKNLDGHPVALAVQNKDQDILYHSASGGVFSAIGMWTINKGGSVYGAAYDDKFRVHHTNSYEIKGLSIFRSSKYVQSIQEECFSEIRDKLHRNEIVCYSGTPCQVSGLKHYLGNEYDNLITVDLVCKGVASPEVLRQYVELMQNRYKSKIIGMNFKRKTYGYHSSTMSLEFENGSKYNKGGITDLMMRSFRANICLRPSCTNCSFKGKNRISDLTIFDCWHFDQLTGVKDDDRGHTAVLVHTDMGRNIINECNQYLNITSIDTDEVIRLDGVMVNHMAKCHSLRDEFMKDLAVIGLEKAIDKYIPVSETDYIKEASKKVLYKIGLLNIAKKLQGE